jgi:AcrR family transcriptional regulator
VTAVARKRLSREQQREQTNARLIASARIVFARLGYHRALLKEIAEEAGYSTGAIYANFDSKEDLFLAVLDDHVAARVCAVERAVSAAGTPAQRARAGADNWMQFLREDPDWYRLFIEFWSYAQRDPELRAQVAARFVAFPKANAELIEAGARDAGVVLSEGLAESAGTLFTALADGLALMKLLDPEAVPDELFGDALSVLYELATQVSHQRTTVSG